MKYRPDRHVSYTHAQQADIERHWRRMIAAGRRMEDLPLYRLEGFSGDANSLRLQLGPTSYRIYSSTNVAQPEWAQPTGGPMCANPLALSAVMVTADGFAVLQQRSARTGEYPSVWHITPSGHLHPPDSPLEALLAETEEELGASPEEVIGSPEVIGLLESLEVGKPELILRGRLSVTSQEILARRASDAWEYDRLVPLSWDAATVTQWLSSHEGDCVPPGHAAILLAAAGDFAHEWLERRVETALAGSP